MVCYLESLGYPPCGNVVTVDSTFMRPCDAGLRKVGGYVERLIYDIVLSRPEDYLSIYQSCCNHNCLKCHSWYFSQYAKGKWMKPEDILKEVLKYRETVTVWEPRSRATMWHASDLCAHCGVCKVSESKGVFCPGKLKPEQILFSPQGYGPARNIVSFTGGDLYCQPSFYVKVFKLVKREAPEIWIHIETNGYGLVRENLELYYSAGLDSIWLDMKAFDEKTYRELCGTTNKWILEIPSIAKDLGIVLEVVLIYIPGLVELDQIEKFAKLLLEVDKEIPITILAFFPEYLLSGFRKPTYNEMVNAYRVMEKYGLKKVRLGNVGVFCKTTENIEKLIKEIGREAVGL